MKNKLFIFCLLFLCSFGIVQAWNGLIAENWDRITLVKWNELVAGLQSKLWKTNVLSGTGVTISAVWDDIIVSAEWNLSVLSDKKIYTANSCEITNIDYKKYMNSFVENENIISNGPEISVTNINDFDNSTYYEESLYDNNYTNVAYSSTSNSSFAALDFWSVKNVWLVKIYWYNPSSYGSTDGKIQWSLDGSNWDDLVTWITKTTGNNWDFTDFVVSGNYRYIRYFSVQGLNWSWMALTEVEAFEPGSVEYNYSLTSQENININGKNGKIEICNNNSIDKKIEINYLK